MGWHGEDRLCRCQSCGEEREEPMNEWLSVERQGILNVNMGSGSRLPGAHLGPPLTSCAVVITLPLSNLVASSGK